MPCEHVLIAEDEKGLQVTLGLLLRQENYRVSVASNGYEAYNTILSLHKTLSAVDLLVSDLHATLREGDELLASLKNSGIPIPVIILTEYAESAWTDRQPDTPLTRYITKPFEPQLLLDSIREILDQHKSAIQPEKIKQRR